MSSNKDFVLEFLHDRYQYISMRKNRPKMDQVKSMLKPIMEPKDLHHISKTVGCSLGLIHSVRKEMGLPMFKRGGRRRWTDPKRIETARRLKIAGWTYAEIGRHLGVSTGSACSYLRIKYNKGESTNSCENCGKTGVTLSCHHISYEDDSKFKLLCKRCHGLEHTVFLRKYNAESRQLSK